MRGIGIRGFVLCCLALLPLFYFSPELLMVQNPLDQADAIVVLGGESGERVFRAAEAYQQNLAPLMVVAGGGDCNHYKRRLNLAGVPLEQIKLECKSRSTKENAEFSAKILRDQGVKKAIIVTTWWHTARAVRCFEHFAPEIEFLALPAYHGDKTPEPTLDQAIAILIEYVKTVYYAVWYGIY